MVGPACGVDGELGCLFDAKLPLLLRMKAVTAAFAAGDCTPAGGSGPTGLESCWDGSGLLVISAGGFAKSLIARPMVLRFLARAAWPS